VSEIIKQKSFEYFHEVDVFAVYIYLLLSVSYYMLSGAGVFAVYMYLLYCLFFTISCWAQVAGAVCHACGRGSGTDDMLMCDDCSLTYHNGCLIHPLAELPRSEWRCPKCVARVNTTEQIWCIIHVITCNCVISHLMYCLEYAAYITVL